ncbi:hypothetical protein NL529_31510, partial [Klebsiella pneumoniae]|nr:hypothetical protein [Klebsiella pneumoniae]
MLEAVRLLRAEGFRDFTVEINGDNLQYASPARRQEIEDFRRQEEALPAAERNVFFTGSYSVE